MDRATTADCTRPEQVTEERLATFIAFFQDAPVAMILLDADRRIREMNRAAEETFASASADSLGSPFGNAVGCIHSLESPAGCSSGPACGYCPVRGAVAETFESGQGCRQVEARLALGDRHGSKDRYVLVSTSLLESAGRRRVLVSIEDITKQKRAEAALRNSNATLAEAQRIAHVGNWDWDVESNELKWSDEVYRIFGRFQDDFEVSYDTFLDCVHDADRGRVEHAVAEAIHNASHYSIEHRIVLPDGSERTVHERAETFCDETGRPTSMVGTVQDITEQKTASRKLQKALRRIRQLKDRLQEENLYLREEIRGNRGHGEIIGESESLQHALRKVENVAGTDANVLLTGETGTGKELFARAIHNQSRRKDRTLVKVNCAALPPSLIESELFGHVEGAFTGAIADKAGRFQLADGGTLFLDEIGELEPEIQAKLLRVLQEGEFERVGGTETIKVDVRVIAATNRDVDEDMRDGTLRRDLYYRLAVFPIEIPALRMRREDIPLLVWHFVDAKRHRMGKDITRIPADMMNELLGYDWPGNVRELENVVERAMILSTGPTLALEPAFAGAVVGTFAAAGRRSEPSSSNLEDIDRAHIVEVLNACDWKIKGASNAAQRLGLKPSTLRYRMKKLGIERPDQPPRRPR